MSARRLAASVLLAAAAATVGAPRAAAAKMKPEKPAAEAAPAAEWPLSLGPRDAPHSLVVYADFECSFCAKAAETAAALRREHGDRLRLTVKMTPLPSHRLGREAAALFEAASFQSPDRAWLFHDLVFRLGGKLTTAAIRQAAVDAGLDLERAERDARGAEVERRLAVLREEFLNRRLSGLPVFVADGTVLAGFQTPAAIDAAFGERPAAAPEGAAPAGQAPPSPTTEWWRQEQPASR